MTEQIKLTPRLSAAADFVMSGAVIADIGTDHAYLPIALCMQGKICGGVASDINEGPILRARENIKKYGLDSRLSAIRTDGLDGIEVYSPDHIMILGMGGELIARIINDAPWVKKSGIRLCLQPMTHPEKLRELLCNEGFGIIDEKIVIEEKENKIYQILLAEYTGKGDTLTGAELLLGRINAERGGHEFLRLAEHHIGVLERRVKGKQSAKADATAEIKLIEEIKSLIKEK